MSRIALAGNPNIGKTTVFNALTGANQKVSNWPGVTVFRKEGIYKCRGNSYTVIDLPGTYSLGDYSEDEKIATDYILSNDADLILNVVDSTNLERNLFFTMQLLEMDVPIVVALNMMDEAERFNININIEKLEKSLGVPVVPITASRGVGIDELKSRICDAFEQENLIGSRPEYKWDEIEGLKEVLDLAKKENINPPVWESMRYMSGDEKYCCKLSPALHDKPEVRERIKNKKEQQELDIIDLRYRTVHKIVLSTVNEEKGGKDQFNDKIDKIVMHPIWGIPIFAFIMFVVFQLTFTLGEDLIGDSLEALIENFGAFAEVKLLSINASPLLAGFISDGLIAGIGTVLTFIPLVVILYILLGFLEDIGYMARAAYIMDDFMRKIGLQGKALVSMIVGFGCNVPGVMATRTLENENDRMIAILINPFMSCGAKIPVYAMMAGIFFPKYGGLVTFGLYVLGFVVAIIVAKILSLTLFKGKSADFIMELPPYRAPILKNVVRNMADNVLSFIKRAATIITVVISFIYLLSVLPYGVEPYSASSYIGKIGSFVAPIFKPAGLGDWQSSVGLIAGMPAKEGVTATLSMIYGANSGNGISITEAMRAGFTPLSALSYLVIILLYTPCIAVLSTVKAETGKARWAVFMAVGSFVVAYIVSVLIYQIGALLGFA